MGLPATATHRADDASDGPALSLDSWRTPDADRPVFVELGLTIDPTGTTEAELGVDVDEGGGTTADYTFNLTAAAGLGGTRERGIRIYVPAGGSYQVRNISNPDTGNSLDTVREWVL